MHPPSFQLHAVELTANQSSKRLRRSNIANRLLRRYIGYDSGPLSPSSISYNRFLKIHSDIFFVFVAAVFQGSFRISRLSFQATYADRRRLTDFTP
jgi:hypothetical protein